MLCKKFLFHLNNLGIMLIHPFVQLDIKFYEGKAMRLSLERELDLHAEEEILVPEDEPQDVEQPHEEDHGVAEKNHEEPSIRNGRRRTMKAVRKLYIIEQWNK